VAQATFFRFFVHNLKNIKSCLVIGAGPSGLVTAHSLLKSGYNVTILESSGNIGGMCQSINIFDQTVDLGPHRFFSSDKIINDYFHEVIGVDFTTVNRQTRIYYNNRFFDYPLKVGNVLSNLGILQIIGILMSYALVRIGPPKNTKTFEEWVVSKFGKKLFNIFFKTYTEKLWGIPCTKIDAQWASQRIKKLSLWEAVKAAFIGNIGNKHKTLVDQFAYPINGTGAFYKKIEREITKMGGKILLNTKAVKLYQENNKIKSVELLDGSNIEADCFVSTMPLTHLVSNTTDVPAEIIDRVNRLYFRNTTLVYCEINNSSLFTDNWIYIHSPEVQHGRITNFRNWCPSLYGKSENTILCLEYWSFDYDDFWSYSDESLHKLANKELKILNLLPDGAKILNNHVVRIPKCYPVYETDYMDNLQPVIDYIEGIDNLYPIGRYGSFKYNNQDHSILMGLLVAKEIKTGEKQNLWEINSDSDYQEDAEYNLSGYKS